MTPFSKYVEPIRQESPEGKAVRLLKRQLAVLQETIRSLDSTYNPKFTAWRDTTRGMLERFLGKDSHHAKSFSNTIFCGVPVIRTGPGGQLVLERSVTPEDIRLFHEGCKAVEETLKAAIDEVVEFGVHTGRAEPASIRSGRTGHGVSQTFNASVSMNQAIATDHATQYAGQIGNTVGSSLKAIAALLSESDHLTRHEVRQGVADTEALEVEAEKPEAKRNWKAVLDSGQRILELAGKAVDLGTKIGPYLPAVVSLVERATHGL
jgi:hypothetical protein